MKLSDYINELELILVFEGDLDVYEIGYDIGSNECYSSYLYEKEPGNLLNYKSTVHLDSWSSSPTMVKDPIKVVIV